MAWLMFKSSASVFVPRRLTLVASAVILLQHGAARGGVDAKALGCGLFDGQIFQPDVVAVNRQRAPTGAGEIQIRPVARRCGVVEEVDIQLVVRGVLPCRAGLRLDGIDGSASESTAGETRDRSVGSTAS